MRLLLILLLCVSSPAVAREVWRGDLPVEVGETEVDLPILLEVDSPPSPSDPLALTVFAVATPLISPLEKLLEESLQDSGNGCEKRVSTPGVAVAFKGNHVRMEGEVRVEVWLCGLIKTRVARETGRVRLAIEPMVQEGRLRFVLKDCGISDLDAIAQALNLEAKFCTKAQASIDRTNTRAKIIEPPLALARAGFSYSGLQVFQAGGQAILIGALEGPNDGTALLRFLANR